MSANSYKVSMGKKSNVLLVIIGLVVVMSVVSASAFTTATLEREANIVVENDATGLIELEDGETDAVFIKDTDGDGTNDELAIDLDSSTASGLGGPNPAATYKFGDESTFDSDAADTSGYVYAFNMTVTDQMTGSGTTTLGYTDPDGNTDANVKFEVYTAASGGGTLEATVTEESDGSFTASTGTTYWAVLIVDTGGGSAADLNAGDDLSGTLNVTIS